MDRPQGVPDPATKVKIFEALCWSRATRWRAGRIRGRHGDWLGYAVDPLQRWAEQNGLVAEIGQDEVQRIMGEAFYEARKDGDSA